MKQWICTSIAVALAGIVSATAGEHARPKHAPHSFIGPRVIAQLDLTETQKDELERLSKEFRKQRDALVGHRRSEGMELRQQMKAARQSGDEAKLAELRQKMRQHMEPMRDLRQNYIQKLRATLTADQQRKLDQALQQQRKRMAERREEILEGKRGPRKD